MASCGMLDMALIAVERKSIELGVFGMYATCCLSVSKGLVPRFHRSNIGIVPPQICSYPGGKPFSTVER